MLAGAVGAAVGQDIAHRPGRCEVKGARWRPDEATYPAHLAHLSNDPRPPLSVRDPRGRRAGRRL